MELPLPPSKPDEIRRVAFLGTPALSVPTLAAIHDAGYEVPLVVSGADKRRGRGSDLSPTPVKAAALERGLNVTTDVDDLLTVHRENPIDLAVVVAFGKLIKPHVLAEIPMVNIHFSPLPRWRGAAPVERAILAGDPHTAICIMSVVEGLDEGDVWASVDVPIESDSTLLGLWESMSLDGATLLVDTMRSGFTDPQPQVGEPLYARKLQTDDSRLDWNRTAVELHRVIRIGRAWSVLEGERFKIHEADIVDRVVPAGEIRDLAVGTPEGSLRLRVVQPAGKPRMDAEAWANGADPDGLTFESEPTND